MKIDYKLLLLIIAILFNFANHNCNKSSYNIYFSALYHNSNNGSGIFGRDASFNSGNSRASSELGDEERDMHSDISLEEDVNDLNHRVS